MRRGRSQAWEMPMIAKPATATRTANASEGMSDYRRPGSFTCRGTPAVRQLGYVRIPTARRSFSMGGQAQRRLRMRHGPVLPPHVIQEDYWPMPDTSSRQRAFFIECLGELDAERRDGILRCFRGL